MSGIKAIDQFNNVWQSANNGDTIMLREYTYWEADQYLIDEDSLTEVEE